MVPQSKAETTDETITGHNINLNILYVRTWSTPAGITTKKKYKSNINVINYSLGTNKIIDKGQIYETSAERKKIILEKWRTKLVKVLLGTQLNN